MRERRSQLGLRGIATLAMVMGGLITTAGVNAWFSERKWSDGTDVVLQVNLGSSPELDDGCGDWNCVVADALGGWNIHLDRTRLGWTSNGGLTSDRRDRINAVLFGDRVQGETFGSRTLAVTVSYSANADGRLVEADVVFNRAFSWNSYRGPLRRGIRDFRRVAIHEFGHALGFDHPDENGQRVGSIMNSTDSDVDSLTLDDIKGAFAVYGIGTTASSVPFPPRNETADFRFALEEKYRHSLGRDFLESFVDVEGAVVWTQEYLRYRLNGCSDMQARGRVRWQILGTVAHDPGQAPVCGQAGSATRFPPRNETFGFRQDLERIYRDDLRRGTVRTVVDMEGDVVWIQEYLRYRLTGCTDPVATTKVFQQVDGAGVQADCR